MLECSYCWCLRCLRCSLSFVPLLDRRHLTQPGQRIFNLNIEGNAFNALDVVAVAGTQTAFKLQVAQVVDDGAVSIILTKGTVDNPKISGIEIKLLALHLAHSVTGGPYSAVDTTNIGSATIPVNGGASHTHATGLVVNQWIWKEGSQVLATGKTANLNLPVGNHTVVLTVIDSGGNDSTDETTVSVFPFGFPAITTLSPSSGSVVGNQQITITGAGFTYPASQTTVRFGLINLTGSVVQVINSSTIKIQSPPVAIGSPVSVTVQTPFGTSSAATFTYVAASPIAFTSA